MGRWTMCINTQTPLLQFLHPPAPPARGKRGAEPPSLEGLREGVDFRYSPGGVTRMVQPLVRHLRATGHLGVTHWVSLSPVNPEVLRVDGVTHHAVSLDPERMGGYGVVKEAIWGASHGAPGSPHRDMLLWSDAFGEYAYYNRATAERIRALDQAEDFDLFYIHDFQQIAIGQMLSTVKPIIFRWHIPFDAATVPEEWRSPLRNYLASYDTVVVSTDRYRRSLAAFGHRGRIRRIYPYVDAAEFSVPPPGQVRTTAEHFGVKEEDEVALLVGRMDPTKGQDRAIEALAHLRPRFPRLKLVLAGNGSFSGSKSGLGLSKSSAWRSHLESRVRELDLSGRVVFTGYVSQHQLDCLYERCRFTLLPSLQEGFGLVVVESWLHGKPAFISRKAGVAELAKPVARDVLIDPASPRQLADRMARLLEGDETLEGRLADHGRESARQCVLDTAVESEVRLLEEVVEE